MDLNALPGQIAKEITVSSSIHIMKKPIQCIGFEQLVVFCILIIIHRMKKSTKKIIKITSITLAVVIGLPVLVVGSYVVYVVCSYHRIGNQALDVDRNSNIEKVETDKELTVSTFNVGFGAYSPDYTFILHG